MLKAYWLFPISLLVVSSPFATPYNGFYFGAGIGGSESEVAIKTNTNVMFATATTPPFTGALTADSSTKQTDSSMLGSIYAG